MGDPGKQRVVKPLSLRAREKVQSKSWMARCALPSIRIVAAVHKRGSPGLNATKFVSDTPPWTTTERCARPRENAMATPTKWGSEINANTTTAGNQYESQVTALANGRFVVVWTDQNTQINQTWVRSQVFNADGSKFGPESIIEHVNSIDLVPPVPHPQVAARPDGGYVVTWNSGIQGGDISGQIFDVNGAKVGTEFTATPAGAYPVDSAVAGGNFFAVTWIDAVTNSVRAQIYNPQGNPSGGPFTVSTITPGTTLTKLAVTELEGGAFVATWIQDNGSSFTAHTQAFSALGQKIGIEYATSPSTNGAPTVSALANGGYVVAWIEWDNGTATIQAQMFGANGSATGSQFQIGPSDAGLNISDIKISGLPDGRLAAVWKEFSKGIGVQLYNADGSASGDAYYVADDFGSSLIRDDPTISTLADGRIVVSWTLVNPDPQPGAATFDIGVQIFEPREAAVDLPGTILNDDLIGTKYNDTLRGGDGADKLDGSVGDDLLIGGAGGDKLIGGIGNDTASYFYAPSLVKVSLATGFGTAGEALNDTLSGIENLIGSRYNDTLTGNIKDNVLTGSAGGDILDGAGGSDTASYEGSSAPIKVNLATGKGSGGDAQNDQLISIENLLGSSFGDTLIGDTGSNKLAGAGGNDTLTGGAGSDFFVFDKLTDGIDTIKDFMVGSDRIQLGVVKGPIQVENGTAANTPAQTVLFDEYTGSLSVDTDGNGALAPTKLATIQLAGAAGVQTISGILGYSVLGTGDFNGDGTSDIVLRNFNNGATNVWEMSNGQIVDNHGIGNRSGYSLAGTGDFNGDGSDDMLWKNNATGVTETWLMQNGDHTGGFVVGNMTGFSALGTGDFDGDGTSDILWRNDATGATELWKMNGGQLGSSISQGNTAGYNLLGTGDFNGDGTTDLLWQNTATGTVEDWLMKNGQKDSGFVFANTSGQTLLGTGDFNHDGTDDLLWRNNSTGEVVDWLLKDGNFGGGTESFGIAAAGLQKIGVGDFNNDGGNDVLWYDPGTNSTQIWDIEHQKLSASDFLISS
jgi:Ca2+-binding RTX toxin-like protein